MNKQLGQTQCQKPRGRIDVLRGAYFVFTAIMAFTVLPACGIIIGLDGDDGDGGTCEPLVCDLACDQFQTDDEGCEICACEETNPPGGTCWGTGDCATGQICDTTNFCEPPPGCADGADCPAVCYGHCVEAPTVCTTDAQCGAEKICRTLAPSQSPTNRPGPQDQAPACDPDDANCDPGDPVDPDGVCVPVDCGEGIVVLPSCPPGTQLALDFTQDVCGEAVCIPTEGCRDLDPNLCQTVPGCHLEEVPAPCECDGFDPDQNNEQDPAQCYCPDVAELICVPDGDDCGNLSLDECYASNACYPEFYDYGCGNAPVECDADGNCDEPMVDCLVAPPEESFVCLPYQPDQHCYSNADCPPGDRCDAPVACTTVCYDAEDGTSDCFEECWQEPGVCVDGGNDDCYALSPEECLDRPDCLLEDLPPPGVPCDCGPDDANCECNGMDQLWVPVCVPAPNPSCLSDEECPYGWHCEVQDYCPPCSGEQGDPNCLAPCWIEGQCVPGQPNPTECQGDDQCAPGYQCEEVTVCTGCAYPDPAPCDPDDPNCDNGQIPPPPCDEECWVEGICTPVNNGECYSDWDCGPNAYCEYDDANCFGEPGMDPNGDALIACPGRCVEVPPPDDLCWTDQDCGDGFRCNTEDYCAVPGNPGMLVACLGVCEPLDPNGECMDDGDCGADQFCLIEECTPNGECYGRCEYQEPPQDVCLEDADCSQGFRCATELDVCACPGNDPFCEFTNECYSLCVPVDPPVGECFVDEDCQQQFGPDAFCEIGPQTCDPATGECYGFCVIPDDPNPQCQGDADCPDGSACIDGICGGNGMDPNQP